MSAPTVDHLRFVRKFPDKCCAQVTRKGEFQPCDKTAVAVVTQPDDDRWWPVCIYHAYRQVSRRLVPLAELLEAARRG